MEGQWRTSMMARGGHSAGIGWKSWGGKLGEALGLLGGDAGGGGFGQVEEGISIELIGDGQPAGLAEGSQYLRWAVQVFLHDLGVNFYGVRTLASEELFKVASLVIGGASLPTLPKDANPLEGQRAEDDVVAFAFGFHVLVILPGPSGVDDGSAHSTKVWREARGMPAPMDPSLCGRSSAR